MRLRLITALFLLLLMSPLAAQQLTLLHTSDMHSRVEPYTSDPRYAGKGGLLRRANAVDSLRRADADLLLFDCGDFSQGTPYYNLFKGEVEVKMMNLMKYDAATIGNHEFDMGLENMARLFRMAAYPIVCANYDFAGTCLEGLVRPYVVLQRKGIKIGVFGLSPKLEGLVQAANCEGVSFRSPMDAALEVVHTLRYDEGCDVVICLSHLGIAGLTANDYSDSRLVPAIEGVDVVLGGHSHTFMNGHQVMLDRNGHPVAVHHPGSNGVNIGRVVLECAR